MATPQQLENLAKGRGKGAKGSFQPGHPHYSTPLKGAEDGKPWPKEVSGNPKGTQGPQLKKVHLKQLYETKKTEWPPAGDGPASQDLARKLLEKAIDEGDIAAIKEVLNRLEGPVTQRSDITTGGQPFKALIGVDIDDI